MRVCFFPNDFDGQGFYRCLSPAAALRARGHEARLPNYVLRQVRSGPAEYRFDVSGGLPDCDVFVFQMPRQQDYLDLMGVIQRSGRKVVVEIDDYLKVLPRWHPAAGNARKWWEHMLGQAVRLADLVTVSTGFLADEYGRGNDNVVVLPNRLDEKMWSGVPMGYERRGRKLRVGWMGAARMRSGDVKVLKSFLPDWLKANPQVEFVAAGSPSIIRELGVREEQAVALSGVPLCPQGIPFLPYITAVMDVGLVPLERCLFNEAKSALKGMEYAACGIPCVASPSAEYRGWVDEGVNGFLAATPDEWMSALDALVADEGLRRDMGRAARAKAERNWIADHIEDWERAYASLGVDTNASRQEAAA